MKKGQAIFAFTLKNGAGATDSWHIDLKDKGAVGKGEAPDGKKADGEYEMSHLQTTNAMRELL